MVASDIGGCNCRDRRERPGKEVKKPDRIAWCKVDKVGEKRAAW